MTPVPPVRLIAVVGGSGAGKSWLAGRLCRLCRGHAGHLSLDCFYRDRSDLPPARRDRLNFDQPGAIDWAEAERVLRACRAGEPTAVPNYDFATHRRVGAPTPWAPRPLIIVEGLWLLRPPALRALFDLTLFLDTPAALRCSRRLARDVAERGATPAAVGRALRTRVLPQHDRYVAPQRALADLVLSQPFRAPELAALADRLWPLLAGSGLVPPWEGASFRAELSDLLSPSAHACCA